MHPEPETSRGAVDALEDLEPDLLRSVPLHVCLAAGAWQEIQRAGASVQDATGEYEFFFSHDWKTSRWLKQISLLAVFNGVPAAASSFIISFGLGVMASCGLLSRSAWLLLPGHIAPFLVLLFWQDMRRLFLRPRRAFLDSLCIPQEDPILKERCIRRLTSYLSRSKKLICLWSPDYFRRLWCTFEVGFFLMRQGQVENITFVPVQIGTLCTLCYATATVFRLTLFVVQYSGLPFVDFVIVVSIAVFVLAVCLTPAFFLYWSALLRDVADLPRQLREFRLQRSECFCCSHGHRHPVSGDTIFCDRTLIYQNLKAFCKWKGGEEDMLDLFNGHVHRVLAPSIQRKSRHNLFVLKYTLIATLAACFPHLSVSIPRSLEERQTGWEANVLFAGSQLFLDLAVVFLLRVTLLIGQLGHRQFRACFHCHRNLAIAVQVAAFCLAACGVLLPWPVSVILAEDNSMAPFASVAVLLFFNLYLYKPLYYSSRAKFTPASMAMPQLQPCENLEPDICNDGASSCFEV